VEKSEIKEECPTNILFTWDDKLIKTRTNNTMIIHSVQTWYKLWSPLEQGHFLPPKTPLWGRLLSMCHQNNNFKTWADKGIKLLEHCFDGDALMSFEQLKIRYEL